MDQKTCEKQGGGKCHSKFCKILQFFAIPPHLTEANLVDKGRNILNVEMLRGLSLLQYKLKGIFFRDIHTFLNTTRQLVTDYTICVYMVIRQMLEKKWEYNEAVHQLFIDFKKVYNSVRREVLYNIRMEFGIPKKLIRLITFYK